LSTGRAWDGGPRAESVGGGLVALAAVLFGSVVVLGKRELERGISVYSLLAIRFGVAAVILFGILVALRRPLFAVRGERASLAALAVFGYAVEATLFFSALEHGTAAAVTLLFYTYPVFVTFLSWAAGADRLGPLTLLGLVLAVGGASIVAATGGGLSIQAAGLGLALASALTYSTYLVGTDRVIRRTSSLTTATWVSAGASLGLFAFAALTGKGTLPSGGEEWWPVLGMGVATAGAFVCLMEGIRRIGAVRTAIISAMEPLAAAGLAVPFLGESVTGGIAFGGTLILGGAIAASLARAPTSREQLT
jgi:drug/metabolite transporter (DMT)-like permease